MAELTRITRFRVGAPLGATYTDADAAALIWQHGEARMDFRLGPNRTIVVGEGLVTAAKVIEGGEAMWITLEHDATPDTTHQEATDG